MTTKQKHRAKPARTVWFRSPKEDFRVGRDMFNSMPLVKVMIVLWFCSLPCVLFGFIDGDIALRVVILPAMLSFGTVLKRHNDGVESLSIAAGVLFTGILMAPMIIA